MATTVLSGPFWIDFGAGGLAPQATQGTWWFGWWPPPKDFTVSITAHGAGRLCISETSVEYVMVVKKPDPFDLTNPFIVDTTVSELIIRATLVNQGMTAIRYAQLVISFVMP